MLGAAAFIAMIPFSGRWSLLPMWLAFLLAVFAVAYWFDMTSLYQKKHGRIRWTVLIAGAPHAIGTSIARQMTARRLSATAHEIVPGLWLGRLLRPDEAVSLVAQLGLVAAVDLTAEHSEAPALRHLAYLNVPVLDMTAPSSNQIETASRFIAEQLKRGAVYVHCGNGIARSAVAVAGYLLMSHTVNGVEEACAMVSSRRPDVKWRPDLIKAVTVFDERLRQSRNIQTQSAQGEASRSA